MKLVHLTVTDDKNQFVVPRPVYHIGNDPRDDENRDERIKRQVPGRLRHVLGSTQTETDDQQSETDYGTVDQQNGP